jgi:tetratricopeptide (TPR) repeat protein
MSRRDSSRITQTLHRQYREAAQAGQWQRCLELAEQLRGLERDDALAAEAVYAYGLALEMLGDARRAAMQYQTALMLDRGNAKARRRLGRLEARRAPPGR